MTTDRTLPGFWGRLLPFRALRFAPEHVEDLADLVVPPRASVYLGPEAEEVAGPPTVQRLFPHPNHMESDHWDPMDRALIARRYAAWREQGHLQWDDEPGMYVHRVGFTDPHGNALERQGFYAVVAVGPGGTVRLLPHEQTLPDRVKRQVEIFMWRGAQVLPLLVLYQDPRGEVLDRLFKAATAPPATAFTDSLGQANGLWQVTDAEALASVQRWFEGKDLMLADGHHRFDAARAYWRALKEQGEDRTPGLRDEDLGADAYAVAFLTPAESPGLWLGTFHRGARFGGGAPPDIARRLGPHYHVEALPLRPGADVWHAIDAELDRQKEARAATASRGARFVLYAHGHDHLYRVHRLDPLPETAPPTERLDVSDVHDRLLPALGQLDGVEFHQDPRALVEAVRSGRLDLGCFLLPPTTAEVWDVARSRVPMPPKTTYFFPKLPAGLLHFPLEHLIYKTPA